MKYILDTHTFLWAYTAPQNLGRQAEQIITTNGGNLYISAAVFRK
ncbi:MAG TPA: hypothetical protein PKJ70_03870 [Chitinophagaceae bacterium]|nr:hypothetical protein [Chitinophagaceae bacterium]HNM33699.1 hypothetical protein [Chitinophagaceae bacterium]HNN31010.1 hypothetical protein [Chitinophagaceae bacterium]